MFRTAIYYARHLQQAHLRIFSVGSQSSSEPVSVTTNVVAFRPTAQRITQTTLRGLRRAWCNDSY